MRFIEKRDCYLDTVTVLEWKKGKHLSLNWKKAIEYCENLGHGWRLPTIEELFSIVDFSKKDPACRITKADVQSSYYWSSNPCADSSNHAWSIYMGNGHVSYYNKSYADYAWPVRKGE